MMDRPHRNDFWRVEQETWDHDTEDGYYAGTETFIRGTSSPYLKKKDAVKAAIQALERGDWVKLEHYPSPDKN
jgi:hypothetical protein